MAITIGDQNALDRYLAIRDLRTVATQILELHDDADGVEITASVKGENFALDVTYTLRGMPLGGWGQ